MFPKLQTLNPKPGGPQVGHRQNRNQAISDYSPLSTAWGLGFQPQGTLCNVLPRDVQRDCNSLSTRAFIPCIYIYTHHISGVIVGMELG